MRLPFVITIPHCSNRIPRGIRSALALGRDAINDSVDLGTAEIFGSLDAAEILLARWSRLVVDLNRDPRRRDRKGVIAQVDYHGRPVYRPGMAPSGSEIDGLLKRYYLPYHEQLKRALQRSDIRGLFDGHSLNGVGPSEAPDAGKKRKDIVLSNNGNHHGGPAVSLGETTCNAEMLKRMREVFEAAGFSVSLNHPYTAGFITTHYGPLLVAAGRFAVQVEVNQDLYLIPGTRRMASKRLAEVRERIRGCFESIAGMVS